MGKYSQEQLEAMKVDEPEKYFYYSREDEYRELGIDLDRDDWDTPIYHRAREQDGRDKFKYFYDMACSASGATLITPDRRIVNITQDGIYEFARDFDFPPIFKGEEPNDPPEPLGFWFWAAHYLSFGFYGKDRANQYRNERDTHNAQVKRYNDEMAEFNETQLGPFQIRAQKLEDLRNSLRDIGKDPDACEAYVERIHDARTAAQRQAEEELKFLRHNAEFATTQRTLGVNRLEYLLGTRSDPAKNAQTRQEIIENRTFRKYVFGMEDDFPPDPNNVLMDIELPKCNAFSEHEIALIGFGAICSNKIIDEAYCHPIPGRDAIEDKRSEGEKIGEHSSWYNYTEALFTRKQRDITSSVPWVNNARSALAKALEKYNAGDKSDVAGMLAAGIKRCSNHLMFQLSVSDTHTLADYAIYTRQMLDMLKRDEDLRNKAFAAGLTDQDMKNAAITANIGIVWDRGIDAMSELINNHDMTAEQKTDAVVDIIGLRITQSMLKAHGDEIESSKAYKDLYSKTVNDIGRLGAELSQYPEEEKANKPDEYQALAKELAAANQMVSVLQCSDMFGVIGLDISFGNNIEGMFYGQNRPEELRNVIRTKLKPEELGALPSEKILLEMAPKNAKKYVDAFFPKQEPQAQAANGAPQLENAIEGPAKGADQSVIQAK